MIRIDDNLPYDVLKDGDDIQIVHTCNDKILICFTDPSSKQPVLSWVDSECVDFSSENDQISKKPIDKPPKKVQIKLVYSSDVGLIDKELERKDNDKWDTNRRLHFRFWRVLSLLVAALLVILIM